jgi:aryl-alcohol dehydrogenase
MGVFGIGLIPFGFAGAFPFDRLVRFYDFDQLNRAVADDQSGAVLKAVLRIA